MKFLKLETTSSDKVKLLGINLEDGERSQFDTRPKVVVRLDIHFQTGDLALFSYRCFHNLSGHLFVDSKNETPKVFDETPKV